MSSVQDEDTTTKTPLDVFDVHYIMIRALSQVHDVIKFRFLKNNRYSHVKTEDAHELAIFATFELLRSHPTLNIDVVICTVCVVMQDTA